MTELPARPAHVARLEHLYTRMATRLSPDLARPGAVEELAESVARPLAARVAELIALLEELEADLERASDDDGGDDDLEFDFDFSFEMTPLPGEKPAHHSLASDLTAHAANVCFAARGELRRVARALSRLDASYDGLLGACESARRKIRRSIGAVLDALAHTTGDESPVSDDRTAELEAAIAIRAMYAKFRRDLVTCDESDLRSVNRALRYAAVAIAKMVGAPEFAEVRLTDRSLLLSLQGRILRWARGPRGREGLKLFKDICTAADLLAAINMRQELQQNDQVVVAEVRALLGDGAGEDEFRRALQMLADLRGRDDALDLLVDELDKRRFSRESIDRLIAEVGRIAAEMSATAAPPFQ
jgi:hypothetical protein